MLKQLISFHAVISAGGVNEAAKRLNKVASAVSYDIKKLEAAVGVPLFLREGRRLAPTARALFLYGAVDRTHGDLKRALEHVQHPEHFGEPLRVCCVSGFGRYRLAPALLKRLPTDRPLEMHFANAEDVVRRVERGAAAFGVSYKPVLGISLSQRAVAREELVLISAAKAKGLELRDIAACRFVTYDEYEYVFETWFRAHKTATPARLDRGDHVRELEEAIEAVACGRGVTILPKDAVSTFARNRVRIVRFEKLRCENAIYLLAPAMEMNSADAQLIEAAAQTVATKTR
jgi:DNA-binding transcriptional LysR family regulator